MIAHSMTHMMNTKSLENRIKILKLKAVSFELTAF